MGDYLYKDLEKPNLDHPDSAIRLGSVVHRFRVPRIHQSTKISFAQAFFTVGKHDKTRRLMLNADDARSRLTDACDAKTISGERVVADAKRYQPLIHAILLSCKVQPEHARLDEKLWFEWMSGIEVRPVAYKSEAIMYDLVMTVASEGLGHAASATEHSMAGEFAAASRDYAAAAGIFDFLANDQLPKWISKGSKVDDEHLPAECHAPVAKALKTLFMAHGQQMAVATLLVKEGKPNYSLLAKLCFGIAEQLEDFVAMMRREAFKQMDRIDKDFFTLLTFQINVQRSLSLYFQARTLWDEKLDYGEAIAMLSEATVALQTRARDIDPGVPDVTRYPSLLPLAKELKDLREHLNLVLRIWEKDNNQVYFHRVPQHVAAGKKLQEGHRMNRFTPYSLEEAEPALLVLPEDQHMPSTEQSDEELARQLQEKLNAGLEP